MCVWNIIWISRVFPSSRPSSPFFSPSPSPRRINKCFRVYPVNRRSLPTAVFHLVPRRRIFFFGDRPSFFDSLKKKKNVLTIQRLCILAYNITAIPRTGVQRKKELPPYGIAYVVYTIVFRPFFLFFFFSSARFFSLLPSSCSPTENRSCTRNHYKHSGTSRIKLFPGLLSFGRTIRNLPHHLRVERENEKKKKRHLDENFFRYFACTILCACVKIYRVTRGDGGMLLDYLWKIRGISYFRLPAALFYLFTNRYLNGI